MAQRAVNERAPQDHEHDHRAEFHPFGKGAADQGRGDDEEHALKEHVREAGNRPLQGVVDAAVFERDCTLCMNR